MRIFFFAFALILSAQQAFAYGCHEGSGCNSDNEFWNEWYLERYGRPYDDNYCGPGNHYCEPKTPILCTARDGAGRTYTVTANYKWQEESTGNYAVKICQRKSKKPASCALVSCRRR